MHPHVGSAYEIWNLRILGIGFKSVEILLNQLLGNFLHFRVSSSALLSLERTVPDRLLCVDADRDGVFPDTVVAIAQGIPVGGLGLQTAAGVGCPRHNGIAAPGVDFP